MMHYRLTFSILSMMALGAVNALNIPRQITPGQIIQLIPAISSASTAVVQPGIDATGEWSTGVAADFTQVPIISSSGVYSNYHLKSKEGYCYVLPKGGELRCEAAKPPSTTVVLDTFTTVVKITGETSSAYLGVVGGNSTWSSATKPTAGSPVKVVNGPTLSVDYLLRIVNACIACA